MAAIDSTDLAILSARSGVARLGASRLGFCPDDVEGSGATEPGEYIWKEEAEVTTQWTLDTENSVCGRRPVASFTDSPDPTAPLSDVQYTDTSTPAADITYWYWDFGDGGTSYDQHPVHQFAADGVYVVTLYIESDKGTDTATGTTTVVSPTSTVTGTVTYDDVPVAGTWIGADVYMTVDGVPWSGGPATTDGSGVYTFSNVPAGSIDVSVSGNPGPGLRTGSNSGATVPPATLTLDIYAVGP